MITLLLQLVISLTLSGSTLTASQQTSISNAIRTGDENQIKIVVDEIQQYR